MGVGWEGGGVGSGGVLGEGEGGDGEGDGFYVELVWGEGDQDGEG